MFVGVVILVYAVHRYDRYLEKQIKEWKKSQQNSDFLAS